MCCARRGGPTPIRRSSSERGASLIVERDIEPSTQARGRADEIIAPSDQWQKTRGKKPRRLLAAERKRDEATAVMAELAERIAETPAKSIEGMIAKARCAKAHDADCYPGCDDPVSIFSASIVRDLLAMAKLKRSRQQSDMPGKAAPEHHRRRSRFVRKMISARVWCTGRKATCSHAGPAGQVARLTELLPNSCQVVTWPSSRVRPPDRVLMKLNPVGGGGLPG
jgi:hypothetical protein